MAVKVGSFTKQAGTGNQSVTGVGFTPKLVILWAAPHTADGFTPHSSFIVGAATGSAAANQRTTTFVSQDNVGTTNTARRYEDNVYTHKNPTGSSGSSPLNEATFSSFGGDGFTINWGTNDGAADKIFYLAIGGGGISTKVAEFTCGTSTGNLAVSGVGFEPKLVLFFASNDTSLGSSADVEFDLGAAASGSARWALAVCARDGQANNTASRKYQRTSFCLVGLDDDTPAVEFEFDLVSLDADGFTINRSTAAAGNYRVTYIALGGTDLQVAVGSFSKTTSSAPVDQDVTGPAFPPEAILLASKCAAASSSMDNGFEIAFGASDFTTESAVWAKEVYGNDPTESDRSSISTKAFRKGTNPSTVAAEADASAVSNGFRLSWTTNDANADEILYLALRTTPFTPPRYFKVQRGTVAFGGDTTTVSITPVSATSKAICRLTAVQKSNGGPAAGIATAENNDALGATIELEDTGTLRIRRYSTASSFYQYAWEVWEYTGPSGGPNEFIVRWQGVVTIPNGNLTASQAQSVTDPSKCVPFISGMRNSQAADQWDDCSVRATVTSSPQGFELRRGGSTNETKVSVAFVEFTGSNWSIQNNVTHTFTSALSNETETISNIGLWSNALIEAGCEIPNTQTEDRDIGWMAWPGSSTTTVRFRFSGSSGDPSNTKVTAHIVTNPDMTVSHIDSVTGSESDLPAGSSNPQQLDVTVSAIENLSVAPLICYATQGAGDSGKLYPRPHWLYWIHNPTKLRFWRATSGRAYDWAAQIIQLPNRLKISPAGIASGEAFGTATLLRSNASIIEPVSSRPIPVTTRQRVRIEASSTTRFWVQTNGSAFSEISAGFIGTAVTWETSSAVTRRFTFDAVQVAVGPTAPDASYTGGAHFNLCEGPPALLQVSDAIRNEAVEAPPPRPDEGEHDDPPLGLPLFMPGANRGRFGTALLDGAVEPGGPANLVSLYGPGIFTDTAGKLGHRVPIARVRGLGPFPAAASFYHSGLYFHHDFGRSRSLGLVRVLYRDSASNVAVVRGDGRRNTYRFSGGSYSGAASLRNTLTSPATDVYKEVTPSGTEFYYQYDATRALGKLWTVVDRYGHPVYYVYDANIRLQKIQGPSGSSGLVPYLAYDGATGLCSTLVLEDPVTPASNRTTYFHYDGNRDLLKIVGPELCITYFEYNTPQYLSAVHDPDGFRWYFAYDAQNRVERAIDPLQKAAYFAYDATAPLTAQRDRATKTTYLFFSAFGSPTRVFNVGTPADYYTYDGEGNLTAAKNRLGKQWTYEYDGRANRISSTDPLANRSYFAYDSQDLLRTSIDPENRSAYLDYDASRNRTAVVDPLDKTTYYAYRSTGLLHFMKDRRGNFTYFDFDAKANHTALVDGLGKDTYFEYNSAGEREKVWDARRNASYFAYDKRGRVTEVKDAYLNARKIVYDARCNVQLEADERGNTSYYAYDGNSNRLMAARHMGGADFLRTYFRYDAEERLDAQVDPRSTAGDLIATYWFYDALGRRQRQLDALSNETYWAYDGAHELDLEQRPGQTGGATRATTYHRYDDAARRREVLSPAGLRTYYQFDKKGNLRGLNLDQGWGRQPWGSSPYGGEHASTKFMYDKNDRRIAMLDSFNGESVWLYDDEENVERMVNPRGFATYYRYDALNRQNEVQDGVHFATSYLKFDDVGNIVRRIDPALFETYFTYDKRNRVESVAGPFGTTGSGTCQR